VAPVVAGSLSLMLCLTINYRAYFDLKKETVQQHALMEQIESVKNENLDLQEDIYKLKRDPKTIKREAKKLGLRNPK
jgi:cell division protein FtsL